MNHMKKTLVIIGILAVMFSQDASAFGRRNHAAVAFIAEQHLTPAARKAVAAIYDGASLAENACWPDDNRTNIKAMFPLEDGDCIYIDGKPVFKGPSGKPFSYGTDFRIESGKVYTTVAHGYLVDSEGKYVEVPKADCVWSAGQNIEKLRDWKNLGEEERRIALHFVVHLIGDMHCPSHIHYTDARDCNDLKYPVIYRNRELRYHSFWDTDLLVDRYPGGMESLAYYCDPLVSGTLAKGEALRRMKEIQAGTLADWAADVACRTSRIYDVHDGDRLTVEQLDEFSAMEKDLVMRAGYRLAKVLNEIFR